MFIWSELIDVYHLFLRDIYSLDTYSLKWIQELFHTWLSLVTHERLKLYERCATIYLYGSLDSDIWNSLKDFICIIHFIKIIEKSMEIDHIFLESHRQVKILSNQYKRLLKFLRCLYEGETKMCSALFFSLTMVLSYWVFLVRFLMRQIKTQKVVVLFFLH